MQVIDTALVRIYVGAEKRPPLARGVGEAIFWEKRRRNWPEKGTRDQDCARGDGTVVIWDSDLGLIPLCGGEEIFNARGGGRNGAAHSQVSKARPGARCEKRTGRWRVVLSQVRKSGPGAPNHLRVVRSGPPAHPVCAAVDSPRMVVSL